MDSILNTPYSMRAGSSPQAMVSPSWVNPMVNRPASQSYNQSQDLMRQALSTKAQQQPQIVQGPNIQPDIPGAETPHAVPDQGLMQRLQAAHQNAVQGTAPQQPQPDLSAFKDEGTMTQAGLMPQPLPTKKPTMPSDPTNGQDKYTKDHVIAGQQGVSLALQGVQPTNPIQAQTLAGDQDRMHQDIASIAAAKDPKKAWQEIKKDPFYKDSDFYSGVMATGLAIMSGANPLQAFQAGQGQMEKSEMQSQLKGNRDYLLQNYTGDSVASAISSGDASKLQQKKMTEEERMNAENQIWGERNEAANQEWDRRNKIEAEQRQQDQAASDQRYQQRMQDQLQRSKALIDYRADQKQQQAQANAANYDFDSRTINAELKAPEGKGVSAWSQKVQYFDAGAQDLQQAVDAKKAGDSQTARNAYQQALFNAVRGEIGENRSIQAEDLAHFGADPDMFVKKGNEWSMKVGAAPTDASLRYLQESMTVGGNTARSRTAAMKEQRIKALSRTMDPKRATALVNRAYGGGWHDPLNAFDTAVTDQDRQGALSGTEDISWMTQQQ